MILYENLIYLYFSERCIPIVVFRSDVRKLNHFHITYDTMICWILGNDFEYIAYFLSTNGKLRIITYSQFVKTLKQIRVLGKRGSSKYSRKWYCLEEEKKDTSYIVIDNLFLCVVINWYSRFYAFINTVYVVSIPLKVSLWSFCWSCHE